MRTFATERFTEIDMLYLFEELYYSKITGLTRAVSPLLYEDRRRDIMIYSTMVAPRNCSGTLAVGQYAVCFVVHDPRLSCLLDKIQPRH